MFWLGCLDGPSVMTGQEMLRTPAQECVCHRAIVTHLQTCPCGTHKITREHERLKVPPFQENLSLYLLDDSQTRVPPYLT